MLDDAGLTGTWQSSAEVLGVPGTVLADKLTGHLVREIMFRGSRGGPLTPLAGQLNHDLTHLVVRRVEVQGQRVESEPALCGTQRHMVSSTLASFYAGEAGWRCSQPRRSGRPPGSRLPIGTRAPLSDLGYPRSQIRGFHDLPLQKAGDHGVRFESLLTGTGAQRG